MRKKCERDLCDQLKYLLKELEPWEQKLLLLNRKAKMKMRKEHESYVEEVEKEEVCLVKLHDAFGHYPYITGIYGF